MFTKISRRLIFPIFSKKTSHLLFKHFENNFRLVSNSIFIAANVQFNHPYKLGGRKEGSHTSRYVPPSAIEQLEESIMSVLKTKSSMNVEEWNDFKSDLIDSENVVTEENFSSIVMNTLLYLNQLDLSHSFFKFLEQDYSRPNFLTYLKYLSLCSMNHRTVDQQIILRVLDKVIVQINNSPVLDMKRAEYLIQGLCATDRWRESFNYIDKLVNSKPSRMIYNSLASAAIRNGDEILAWEILEKWINGFETVSDKVIEEFLLVAIKMQKTSCMKSDKFIEKLFNYMQKRSVIVNIDVTKLIEQYFMGHRLKWDITYTKVSRKGVCETCENSLKLLDLKNEEFKMLRDAFLKRVVMKSDVFINTTCKEFNKFMEFIEHYKPFHIVLDGLNVAHTYQGFHSKKTLSFHLCKVVQLLSKRSRKLLVLGRKHMQCWPPHAMRKISERAQLFFTDDISQDDPFLIYAALASGPHTLFISDDLMRDHLSRLDDPKLIYLFKCWQQCHQVYLQCDENNNMKFIEPVRHAIAVQGNMECGWHIPFDDKIILDPYEELNNWLCIRNVV